MADRGVPCRIGDIEDTQSGYDMIDYTMFSSDDMINWRDHGVVFNVDTNTTWANRAYAPDMIYRNGRYYLYFPDGASAIVDPKTIVQGIIIKIVALVALTRGVKAALAARRLEADHRSLA